MAKSNAPIGIYDSGAGGLTVWQALRKVLKEDLIYYADTGHLPYGDKSRQQIISYSDTVINFLKKFKVKAIIAACNTSSALAVPIFQPQSSIPIFGVIEPAVQSAISISKNNRVGLLATNATVNSGAYDKIFAQQAPLIKLFSQGCPKLVPLIEAGQYDGPEVEAAVKEYVLPLLKNDVDTIVLGCTHYPFILPVIRRIAGGDVAIVDPAWQTALNVKKSLADMGILLNQTQANYSFYVSGDPWEFSVRAHQFLGEKLDNVSKHIQSEIEAETGAEAGLKSLIPIWRGKKDE